MSIRARLLAGLVSLAAVGLGVAAVVTYEEQRTFLSSRVDQQVLTALGPILTRLGVSGGSVGARVPPRAPPGRPRALAGRGPAAFLTSEIYGELLSADGKVLKRPVTVGFGASSSPPALPAALPISRLGSGLRLFTVDSKAGSGLRYRAAAVPAGRGTAVVAVSLRDVDQTLHRLVVVEALVGAGVILGLVALGWVVIRIGLLPLERIGRQASEIAGGNLSRRVSAPGARTEVGRLAASLNAMLVRIEEAFADRSASEDRLRQFLSDASHELRTPLASIRGYAELFRLGAARDPDALELAMARIEAEAARMGVLVEDLLMLARLDEFPEARRVGVDLTELAEHAASDTRAVAPARKVVVRASGPLEVLGDPDQLRQVIANLTRNAVIHTPAGSPIELGVWREGDYAMLEVRDHGPGIPDNVGDGVFDRFWRMESGRSRGRGGAGLGLAIVQAIVRAHHGEVHASNTAGGGAVFQVKLPGIRAAAVSASSAEHANERAPELTPG